MSDISSQTLDDIIKSSKRENIKYINNVLNIKGVSDFDVDFIMSRLNLNPSVISLINEALEQYGKKAKTCDFLSYNDYLFKIIKHVELLENTPHKLSKDLIENKISFRAFKAVLNLIIHNASGINLKNESLINDKNIYFSKIIG